MKHHHTNITNGNLILYFDSLVNFDIFFLIAMFNHHKPLKIYQLSSLKMIY